MDEFPKVRTLTGKFMVLPRDHVHAYVVELEKSVVVIDTTLAVSSARDLRRLAEASGKPIEAVLLTHGHPDHYTGLVEFADEPRLASQGCLDFAHREDKAKAHTAKGYLGDEYPDRRVFPDQIVKDGESFTFGGVKFTFSDLGPGESDSDGMWVMEKDGFKHAFVGDTVANRCHCFFRDGHTHEWLAVLDRLEKEFDDSTLLYVGHGATPSTTEAIAWQRGYLKTYHDFIDRLQDRSVPVSRPTQEQLIQTMKGYLPGDATLFLLDYEMDVFMPEVYKQRPAKTPARKKMGRFDNKVALVTGGTSGIGRATAIALAREGARVVTCSRHPEGADAVVKEIRDAGGEVTYLQADVSKAAEAEALVAKAVETYGRLDCAFNNAGIAGALDVAHKVTESDWDEQMEINLKSVWLCMKYEIIQMLKQGGGSIVNQGSAAGIVGLPGALAYGVAKFGVVGLTKTAAMEYVKQNIRINAMCPSFVATPLTAKLAQDYPALVQEAFPFQPIGRMGTPEEIASGVLWMLSDEASFATGMAMSVDGGYVAR